ncbi:unnamed protein product [Paramecium pentaurelia]|uniref:Arrestin-like N-terminal domain-containing protein n=1 Tax=Paramecium pentaurelia TaxID=43138 RepID=A0A8S1SA87_9CILI|nr:unnamed protein product [Paramecium pentaurelia]
MGNQQGSDYGGVYIRTDKPFYFAGEIITGNIYLNIFKDGYPGGVVLLKVSGKEKCHWTESYSHTTTGADGKQEQHTEYVTYSGQTQFYQHRVAIWTFNTPCLPVGQYTFPFQFQLLSHLPGSYFEKGSDFQAKISYSVKAEIESYNKSYKNIKHSQPLVVREPLKQNMTALMGQMEVKASTWCCIDQGTSYIKCVFDKNHYLPGDTAYLWADLDNSNCKLDVKRIDARLINYLTLRDKTGREKVITRTIVSQQIQGIGAGVKAVENDRKQIQLILHNKNSQDGIRPSSNGQLVRSVYRLQVQALLSGCTCCNKHPTVDVPIEIVAPVPQVYNQPMAQPSNWNPQVFQPQIVQFTDSTMYLKDQNQQSNYNYPQVPLAPPQPPNQFGQMQQPMN